jgi:hypothetical protein
MKQSKQTGRTFGGVGLPLGLPTPKLEGVPEAIQPFIEVGMKIQSEILGLCGHRARAWLDWPEKYCACKTMDDLTTAQSDYLTGMQRDYAQLLDGILRDALIEQDEFEEDEQDEGSQSETGEPHAKAA